MLSEEIIIPRRKILKYTIFGIFLSIFSLLTERSFSESTNFVKGLSVDLPITDSMKEVGNEYLKNFPEERSKHILLASIQLRFDEMSIDTRQRGPLPAELKKVVLDDFKIDDVVFLQGWVLSRTEARLAALFVV